jgi:hypothetical protein
MQDLERASHNEPPLGAELARPVLPMRRKRILAHADCQFEDDPLALEQMRDGRPLRRHDPALPRRPIAPVLEAPTTIEGRVLSALRAKAHRLSPASVEAPSPDSDNFRAMGSVKWTAQSWLAEIGCETRADAVTIDRPMQGYGGVP